MNQNPASDRLYCIYEFNECERFLDCISCKVSRRYWDEMNKKHATADSKNARAAFFMK